MQTQVITPVKQKPAKISAKQMMAAKCEGKRKKEMTRHLNNAAKFERGDRNKTAKIVKQQKEYIKSLIESPIIDEDEKLNCLIKMWLTFGDMRQKCEAPAVRYMQHVIRQYRVLAAIYDNPNVNDTYKACDDAYNALDSWLRNFDDLSPNQRDKMLMPLLDLLHNIEASMQHMPKDVLSITARYSAAISAAKASYRINTYPKGVLSAFIAIVGGKSSHAACRQYGLKYSVAHTDFMHIANMLTDIYRNIDDSVPEVVLSLKEVRAEYLKKMMLNGSVVFAKLSGDAHNNIRNIENNMGIFMFDWRAYTQHMKEIHQILLSEEQDG